MNETKTNETYKELTVMEWAEQFKPVANTLREDADIKGYDKNHPERGILFCCDEYANGKNETKHVEDAVKLMPDKVWSFFSIDDGGEEYAVNGYSSDANGYFITTEPWEPGVVYFIDDDRTGETEFSN